MKKKKNEPAFLVGDKEREQKISRLEQEREKINIEMRILMRRYARLTKSKAVLRGLRRVGSAPNDYSFFKDR